MPSPGIISICLKIPGKPLNCHFPFIINYVPVQQGKPSSAWLMKDQLVTRPGTAEQSRAEQKQLQHTHFYMIHNTEIPATRVAQGYMYIALYVCIIYLQQGWQEAK